MKAITFYLVLVLFLFSCQKASDITNIYYSNNSQLWINVDKSVPDFNLTFTSEDNKSNVFTYVVAYSNNVLNPTLRSKVVLNNGVYETWVLVHNNFDRSDKITVKTKDDDNDGHEEECKTDGFEYQEKRLIHIKKTVSGVINITDADITMIETVVYVD